MSPDNSLLTALGHGDASAFEELYDRHSPAMYAVALRILGGDEQLASTALEATFVGLWEGRVKYSPSSGNPTAWLIRIARDQAVAMRPPTLPFRRRSHTPTPRQLVEDVYLGGTRVDDIARTYAIPEEKVRDLLRCGMAELRSELEAGR
jgi:DNA-directed RNA polymerase specialized sigma24 family protein